MDYYTLHCSDFIMSAMGSQTTGVSIPCLTVCSGAVQRKTSKLRVTGLCLGNPPLTCGFPSRTASNVENVSIWWHYHVVTRCCGQFANCSYLLKLRKFDFCYRILPVNNDLMSPGVHPEASKYINSIDQIVVISDWNIHRRTKMYIERWVRICPWAVMTKIPGIRPPLSQEGSIETGVSSNRIERGIIIVIASV